MTPRLSIIVAVDDHRGIGKDNRLLWHIPEDLQRFKRLTTGHVVIMGEKTYHSIGRPLPNRTNIVLSLDPNLVLPGCSVVHSIDEALAGAKQCETEEIFVIGGASIYRQFLPLAHRLYLTHVAGEFGADVFFPEYEQAFPAVISREPHDNGQYRFMYSILEKT